MSSTATTSYNKVLRAVASMLITEGGYSLHHLQHISSTEMRDIVHQLLVMRPSPDNTVNKQQEEELYSQMDTLLGLELQRKTIVDAQQLETVLAPSKSMAEHGFEQICLWKGDITTLKATAIVNAANSALLGCFQPSHKCIDNVIHSMAGPRLRAACNDIMSRQVNKEPAGDAKITPGFALPAKYVLHTVGPQLRHGSTPSDAEREQLKSCYTKSLDMLLATVGDQEEQVSIALPCISTGLFAFPSDIAVPLAVNSVLEWLEAHRQHTRGWKVIFNTFLKKDYDLYKAYIESKCPGSVILPSSPVSSALRAALQTIQDADYLLVSAGAGLSTAAGLDFGSEALMRMVHPNVRNSLPTFRMLLNSIGFRNWDESLMWGFFFKNAKELRYNWSRYRSAPTYAWLKSVVDKFESRCPGSAFVKTSNADGIFGQEGFHPASVFVMQGDFGQIQCAKRCSNESVWDIKAFMEEGLKSFNEVTYRIEDPEGIPKCPNCGGRMSAFLREDETFLDSGVEAGRVRYEKWLAQVMHQVQNDGKKLAILEVGAGFSTPIVLRIPDERLTAQDGVQLVRVNPEYPGMPFQCHGVGVTEDKNIVFRVPFTACTDLVMFNCRLNWRDERRQ